MGRLLGPELAGTVFCSGKSAVLSVRQWDVAEHERLNVGSTRKQPQAILGRVEPIVANF